MKRSISLENSIARNGFSYPGVVLGPYESLVAIALYFNEVATRESWNKHGLSRIATTAKTAFRIDTSARDRVLGAYMLFGPLDASAGMVLFDGYLASRGASYSRREFFGDYGPLRPEPFSHSLESSRSIVHFSQSLIRAEDILPVVPEIVKAIQYAGYVSITPHDGRDTYGITKTDVKEALKFAFQGDGTLNGAMMGKVGSTATYTLNSIARAIDFGVPLLSRTQIGPNWLSSEHTEAKVRILRMVLEEVQWMPKPKNFGEALQFSTDERVIGLRDDISLWLDNVLSGKLDDMKDIREQIRKKSDRFKNKSWASKVSRFLTYASIPVSGADLLLGSGTLGVSSALAGGTFQFLSERLEASRTQTWLSMDADLFD